MSLLVYCLASRPLPPSLCTIFWWDTTSWLTPDYTWYKNMTNVVRVFFCNTTVRSRLSPSVRPLAFTGLVRGGSTRTQRIFECALLCFIKPILGNRYGPGVNPCGTWGGRILTLHLNYVAGYTGPLLFLFERTHQCVCCFVLLLTNIGESLRSRDQFLTAVDLGWLDPHPSP